MHSSSKTLNPNRQHERAYQFALGSDRRRADVPLQNHPVPRPRAEHVSVPGEGSDARRVALEAVDPLAGGDVPDLHVAAVGADRHVVAALRPRHRSHLFW